MAYFDKAHSYLKFRQFYVSACAGSAILLLSACVQSPSPQVKALVNLNPPNFSGSVNKSFTTPSTTFVLNGNCDVKSIDVEYSINSATYQTLADNCSSGTFTYTLIMSSNPTIVQLREKGKNSYSDVATATITFVAPPTAPFLTFVQSSRSDSSFSHAAGSQNTMGLNATGDSVTSGSVHFETYLPGAVYGQ